MYSAWWLLVAVVVVVAAAIYIFRTPKCHAIDVIKLGPFSYCLRCGQFVDDNHTKDKS